MGLEGPRTPAVHRAVGILDAISSGHADTPAALGNALGLAKSSVADLLGALEDEGLIGRHSDGRLHTGARWAALADPDGLVDRLLRACGRSPDLDGHTISVVQLMGNEIICLDVRPGLHPLPLTPRPGQRWPASSSAAAVAILSGMTASAAAEVVRQAADHQGLTEEQVNQVLALRRGQRAGTYESDVTPTGRQLAVAVQGSRIALTLHLPQNFADSTFTRRASRALTAAIDDT